MGTTWGGGYVHGGTWGWGWAGGGWVMGDAAILLLLAGLAQAEAPTSGKGGKLRAISAAPTSKMIHLR